MQISNISQQKSELRKIFKQKRAALSPSEVEKFSLQINQNFIDNLLPKILAQFQKFHEKNHAPIFSLYLANGGEVLTDLIAKHFIKNKINFAYPKIIAKDKPLQFLQHHENQGFAPSAIFKNILEPIDGAEVFPDILIMPLLAFDSTGMRLGMGGGFYDRTIEFLKINKKITTIGLGFDTQLSAELLPHENTDWSLDFTVSAHDIIFAKAASL